MNGEYRNPEIKINERREEKRRVFHILLQITACIIAASFMFLFVTFSGTGAGFVDSADYLTEDFGSASDISEVVTDDCIITDDCIVAEAASNSNKGDSGTIAQNVSTTYINKTYSYTYTGSVNPPYSHFYWAGNSSTNNASGGAGWFQVNGSGTVRQKEIVMTAFVKIKLTGVLSTLRANSKLQITSASAKITSKNGYDQDIKWGFAYGSKTLGSGNSNWSLSGFTVVGSASTTGDGQGGVKSGNYTSTVTSDIITIALSARTNYTAWVGGRYPGAQLSEIKFTFKSVDTTAPSVTLNDVGAWKQSKSISFTVKDTHSGNSLYSYYIKNASGTNLSVSLNSSTYVYTVSGITGALSYSFTDRSGNANTGSKTADALKIDTAAPSISTATFITADSVTGGTYNTSTSYQNLWLKVVATDSQSGVKSVTAKNSTTGVVCPQTRSSGSTYVFSMDANGVYTITVTDNADRVTTKTVTCYNLDKVAPTISYTLDKSTSSTSYANTAVKATFTVTEKADPTYYSAYAGTTYQNLHSLSSFGVTLNGTAITTTQKSASYSNGVWTYVYEVYLPETGTYKFSAKDKSGRTIAVSTSGSDSITPYIDTTAPMATAYSVLDNNGKDARNVWTTSAVTLSITVSDAYTGTTNQGSGLSKVELRRNTISGAIVATYAPSGGISNGYTVKFTLNDNYEVSQTYYWIIYDKAGNSSTMVTQNATFNGKTYTNYYRNDTKYNHVVNYVKKDSNPVNVKVYDSGGTNVLSSASGNNSVLAWTKEESTVLKLKTEFGSSGGKIQVAILTSVDDTNPAWTNLVLSAADEDKFRDAITYPTNRNAQNSVTVSYTATGEGIRYYKFRFSNNAGASYESGVITVRRDRTGPEVKLIGFGNYSHSTAVATDEDIQKRISGCITEESMYNRADWYGNAAYAVISVKDGYSGADGASQEYNDYEGHTATVASLAKAKITFSHNGYSYVSTSGYYQKGNGIWVLVVRLWDINEIKTNCPSMVKADGNLNIKMGQGVPFEYRIQVADFCGNYSNVLNKGGSNVLNYKVDPFDLDLAITSITQTDANGTTTAYNAVRNGGAWTRNKVTINVSKTKMGLSPVWVKYYVGTVTDNPDGTVTGITQNVPVTDSGWSAQLVVGDSGSGTSAKIEFPATSRCVQLVVMLANATTEQHGGPVYYGTASDFMVIRQDTDAPNMKGLGYFLSTNGDIAVNPFNANGTLREDILLYYRTDYSASTGTYTSTRLTNNRDLVNVWIHTPVYLYIIATDATGEAGAGMGSGIKTVTYTAGTKTEELTAADNEVYYDANSFQGIFRSKTTLGYVNATESYELKFRLADNQGNNATFTMAKDTDGHKLLPVVDKVIPLVSISKATYGSPAQSYLNGGKFIGDDSHVLKTDLNVVFSIICGISDAQVYVRRRPYQEAMDSSSLIVVNNSNRATNKYGFISSAGVDLNQWEKIGGKTFTAPANNASWSYVVSSSDAVKNRFDILIVSGTGAYYYMEAGDVFIDTVPPVINDSLTFYSLKSSAENAKGNSASNPIDYSALRTATLTTKTNDSLYAYFRITDENGSGINDAKVLTVAPVSGTNLTKVWVKRIVDGKETIAAYYRMELTESNNYKIEAYDVADNRVESASFKPSIDKNPVDLTIGMKDSRGNNYEFNKGAYSNAEYVTVTLTVSYGLSGRGKVLFATSDDGATWSAYQDLSVLLTSAGSSATWKQNTAGTQSTISFNISKEQNTFYRFRAYNGVTVYRVENGEDVIPYAERGLSNDIVKIAIDKTAPKVNMSGSVLEYNGTVYSGKFVTEDAGAKAYGTADWYADGIAIGLSIADPNVYASGINTVVVNHVLNGVSQDTYTFTLTDGYYYAMNGADKFYYNHYAEYVITLTDRAGNKSTVTIKPKIDAVTPYFDGEYSLRAKEKGGATDMGAYAADTWTQYDVMAYFSSAFSLSGAKLQYARAVGNGNFGEWYDSSKVYNYGSINVADDGKSKTEATEYKFAPEGVNVSFDYKYKFRLVSGAGRISEELYVGRIKIDQEKPEIAADVRTAWGTLESQGLGRKDNEYTTVMTGWTQDNITIKITTPSALVSGFKIVYCVSQGSDVWVEAEGNMGNESSNFQLTVSPKAFIHRINTSKYQENYKYYFMSGSGLKSETYYVNGIKLDKVEPSLNIEAEISDLYGTPDADPKKFGQATASDYQQNKLDSLDASQIEEINRILGLKYVSGTFTNRNSVIVKVSVKSVNFSGVTIMINGYPYESFAYDAYREVSESNPIERYYVVDNSFREVTVGDKTYYNPTEKMYDLDIRLVSGAGKYNNKTMKVAIDNDIPIVYVAGINGEKSTNWDISDPDSCWYVSSNTAINLKIGTLVKDGESYAFSDKVSDSGYTIYYAFDNGGSPDSWNWIDNNTTSQIKIIGQPVTENAIYRFKIVSKSGMEYILGTAALDNSGAQAVSADNIRSIVEGKGGIITHLTTVPFSYRMNVDSTEYTIDIKQNLPFVVNGKNVVEESLDFADYEIVKTVNRYDASGNVIGTDDIVMTNEDYIYRHGDRITIGYTSNVADRYYHRYSVYGTTDADGNFVEGKSGTYGEDVSSDELTGSFTYQFVTDNLKVKSYFIKELDVKYSDTVIYRQSQNEANVKATTSYTYTGKDGGGNNVTQTAGIPLTVSYSDMSGTAVSNVDMPLGGYIASATVDGENAYTFRLVNPQTVLLVKYFDETISNGVEVPNNTDNPYLINNANDLKYVSEKYYKDYSGTSGSFVLGPEYNYYDCAFRLTAGLPTDSYRIERFNGSFDGGNYEIKLEGGETSGDYGLFGNLTGTVKNIVLSVDGRIVVNGGGNVGALASVMDGGTVFNVRSSAEIEISDSVATTNVGGLIGKVIGDGVVGTNVGGVFVDVTVTNDGRRFNGGNIGGLTGYLGGNARVQYSYVYSQITLYNVGSDVNAGAMVGDADKKTFVGDAVLDVYLNNSYIKDNVFINDVVKAGYIGTESNAENNASAIKAVAYDGFVGTASDQPGVKLVAGEKVRNLVLDKLYSDFGVDKNAVTGDYENGLGTTGSPFVIITREQLRAIDGYVNLNYVLNEDVNMTGFGEAIGLHKVFGGKFDGQGHKLVDFNGIDASDGDVIGLFAAVSGTVCNIVVPDVQFDIEGSGTIYAGVIAGRIYGGEVKNVIAVGNISVRSDDTVFIGAISGTATGGNVYDVFSIVNIKVAADVKATAGGIIGSVDGTVMGGKITTVVNGKEVEYSKAVYALGRVEVTSVSSEIGAISATGTLDNSSSDIYAVKDNAYSNGQVVNSSISGAVNMVAFDDGDMRKSTFSDGTNAFSKVFVTDNLYYLEGLGTVTDKFKVTSAEQFRKIEHMLYANYNVANDIAFDDGNADTAFRTIGYGLKFTGSIDGKNENSWSAEEGTLSSLMNVTDALVYENAGSITDLGVNVYYDRTVRDEELVFGAIAVINSVGTLRNVTVSGEINIVGADLYGTTVIVSGFVGKGLGGTFEADSKVQNSISGLNITIENVGSVYAGGYVGVVDGLMTLSYGIGNGTLAVNGCGTVYAGTLVGAAYKENNWTSLDETAEYRYAVTVDGAVVTDLFGYRVYA